MKLTSRIGETKSVSLVKELIVDVHLDYIEKDGYVWRYNEDTKKYYNTGICLMGKLGNSGPPGRKGDNGLSAYLIAKEHGFSGTVNDWLNSLKGEDGKSAFEIWQDEDESRQNASIGDFIAYLKDINGSHGPKYAADETAAVTDAGDNTIVYYIPNGEDTTKYDIILVEDGETKPLAQEIPGDITNYAGIYDVSEDNKTGNTPKPYANLSGAITDIVAKNVAKPGMTIKYKDSDGKYHQYRYLLADVTDNNKFTNEDNWEADNNIDIVDTDNASGLEIADKQGNVLVRFANGDFETKNFNSRHEQQNTGTSSFNDFSTSTNYNVDDVVKHKGLLYRFITKHNAGAWTGNDVVQTNTLELGHPISIEDIEDADFEVSDKKGRVVFRVSGGNVYASNFNSEEININKVLKGKRVAIIGDSISTNGNNGSVPNAVEMEITANDVGVELSAYLTYYDVTENHLSLGGHTFATSEIGTEVTFTPIAADVGKVIGLPRNHNLESLDTWWEQAAERLGFIPIPVCWSGSSITSHDLTSGHYDDVNKIKCSHAWHESQIRKCGTRISGSMERVAPDVVVIYRGTNDFSHTRNVRINNNFLDNPSFQVPDDDAIVYGDMQNQYGFLEGMSMTIEKIREEYPNALVILCTLNVFKRYNCEVFPSNNGYETLPQWNNAIRDIANFMGCGIIEFDKDGITFENCYPTYLNEDSGFPTHPNQSGHNAMARKAISDLNKIFNI